MAQAGVVELFNPILHKTQVVEADAVARWPPPAHGEDQTAARRVVLSSGIDAFGGSCVGRGR